MDLQEVYLFVNNPLYHLSILRFLLGVSLVFLISKVGKKFSEKLGLIVIIEVNHTALVLVLHYNNFIIFNNALLRGSHQLNGRPAS